MGRENFRLCEDFPFSFYRYSQKLRHMYLPSLFVQIFADKFDLKYMPFFFPFLGVYIHFFIEICIQYLYV